MLPTLTYGLSRASSLSLSIRWHRIQLPRRLPVGSGSQNSLAITTRRIQQLRTGQISSGWSEQQ
jgi:hypothetical protein